MNKMLKLFLSAFLVLTVTVTCEHTHDEKCGYDPETKTGCIYDVESIGLLPGEEDPSN